jgi:hypothetical protein
MSSGGARQGSGRPPKARDTVRNKIVRLSVTPSELEVLELLGVQWDVPTATAAYGLLADCIAKCRRQKALAMPDKLIYAASRIVARYEPELQESQT